MIRVLHSIGTLEIGGEQRYLSRLAQRLDPGRFDQTVVFSASDHLLREFPRGVRFVKIREGRPTAKNVRGWLLVRDFLWVMRKWRIDLVTTHGAGIVQIAASAAARVLGKPAVHTIQRPFANRSRTEDITVRVPGLRHAIYSLTDRFVALGSYYAFDQKERWKIPSSKIHLSYIGVDLDRFRPDAELGADARRELGIPAETPLLGVVARQELVKGIGRGLKCFAALRERLPAARLLIVGDGRNRAQNEAEARDLGLAEAAIFTGARTDTSRLMNACDAIMQTTYNPLNGISSIEGMAVGKPIVTVVEQAEEERMAADTCEEGDNGLFVRMTSLDESAACLAAMLLDRERCARMGRASRRKAEERFEIEAHARDIARLYEKLVNGGAHRK